MAWCTYSSLLALVFSAWLSGQTLQLLLIDLDLPGFLHLIAQVINEHHK
jgi:hypothetical protein